MLDNLLQIADLYANGLKNVQLRREQWLTKYTELRDHLTETATYLNTNGKYKQGFFVDTLHAFNEDINGTSNKMPSVSFRSGEMPMLITFRNSMGEKKSYVEEGFIISFNPTITGQIVVLLLPHQSELNKNQLQYTSLAVINDPTELTVETIDQIIARGIETAFYTSFTGMAELSADNETANQIPAVARNPIGFKKYETTERVK
jgi:hypothetical protein